MGLPPETIKRILLAHITIKVNTVKKSCIKNHKNPIIEDVFKKIETRKWFKYLSFSYSNTHTKNYNKNIL